MSDTPERTTGKASALLEERVLRLAARRSAPSFVVLDDAGNVVLQAPDIELDRVLARSRRAVERLPAERASGSVTFDVLDENRVLRIVALSGRESNHTVIFVEEIKDRGSVEQAVRRYRLTRREGEVLGLVMRGLTNGQVAARLYITEATVADHLKNLLRKTKSTKRSELIARIYDGDPVDQP